MFSRVQIGQCRLNKMNQLSEAKIGEIRSCFAAGLSMRKTAAQTGADKNTVNSYFKAFRNGNLETTSQEDRVGSDGRQHEGSPLPAKAPGVQRPESAGTGEPKLSIGPSTRGGDGDTPFAEAALDDSDLDYIIDAYNQLARTRWHLPVTIEQHRQCLLNERLVRDIRGFVGRLTPERGNELWSAFVGGLENYRADIERETGRHLVLPPHG